MTLTNKQKRFCEEYLIDLNATQAAIRAGYSPKTAEQTASRLLRNVKVQEYLAELMDKKESELIASQDEVLKYLTSVMRGKSKSTEIVVEGIGDGCSKAMTVLKEPSEKERLKAAELLGRRYGLYTDKIETDVDMELNITVDYGDKND